MRTENIITALACFCQIAAGRIREYNLSLESKYMSKGKYLLDGFKDLLIKESQMEMEDRT